MKIISRGDTTVVDAYLSPLLRRYVRQVVEGLRAGENGADTRLLFMQSNGGLVAAECFQGKDSILSGPAGGIVGAVRVAQRAGFQQIIAFDMGGTSTDVAHYAGTYERRFETEVAGVRMRAPMMAIHTVAAGGGSILHFDGLRYRVGPDSAGANPGPACYRRGGPLTVTDANVMLGRLPLFPAVFGKTGDLPLDRERVQVLFERLAWNIHRQTGVRQTPEQVAEGFLQIAVENMATAIKSISVQKGYDVSTYTLCCYGAAAGQHACRVADRLGMRRVLLHPFAGVLSAYGMGLADFRLIKDQALEIPLHSMDEAALQQTFEHLKQAGYQEMRQQGLYSHQLEPVCQVFIRYQGTDTALPVGLADKASMRADFLQQHRQRFGFNYPGKPLILESAVLEMIGTSESVHESNPFSAIRENGATQTLPGCVRVEVETGDRIQIATPGGGGYGSKNDD